MTSGWRVSVTCPHGYPFELAVRGDRIVMPPTTICEAHKPKPTRFREWRDARRFRRELRGL